MRAALLTLVAIAGISGCQKNDPLYCGKHPGACDDADCKQKRIAGEEQADQQARFGKDDSREQQIAVPSGDNLREQVNQLIGIGKAPPNFKNLIHEERDLLTLHGGHQALDGVTMDLDLAFVDELGHGAGGR